MTTALITNDDGIHAPGLGRLAVAAMAAGLEITIAAPAAEASGSSASIIGAEEDGRIRFERRTVEGCEGVRAFAVQAAPALITLIAEHGAFGPSPDLVLSGVNKGANVGRAILHSGTVGAALTGGVNGARGLAVSLDVGMNPTTCYWDACQPLVHQLVGLLLAQPAGTVFNLNVPNHNRPLELREAPLAAFGVVQTTMTRQHKEHVRLSVADPPAEQEDGTDAALLAAGYATLTSIAPVSGAPAPVLR